MIDPIMYVHLMGVLAQAAVRAREQLVVGTLLHHRPLHARAPSQAGSAGRWPLMSDGARSHWATATQRTTTVMARPIGQPIPRAMRSQETQRHQPQAACTWAGGDHGIANM
jgi:hypothetical protein